MHRARAHERCPACRRPLPQWPVSIAFVMIRNAAPGELAEVGEIRVGAYQAGGFLCADSAYAPTLRGLGADGNGDVLVAVVPGRAAEAAAGPGVAAAGTERIVGTIMLQRWPHTGPVVTGPDEAEIRALAVSPDTQGQGIGTELLQHLLDRASRLGVRHLVLSTEPEMHTAHRLYERAGFVRLPERDWYPVPGLTLIVYGLNLDDRCATQPPA